MHELLFAYKWLVLLACLGGIIYAGFLYQRWWQWLHSQAAAPASTKPSTKPLAGGVDKHPPLPRTTSITGEQEDLRSTIPDTKTGDPQHQAKAVASTNIITRQAPGGIQIPGGIAQPSQDVLDRLDALLDEDDVDTEKQPSSGSKIEGDFSTTDKWRTTRAIASDTERPAVDSEIRDATSSRRPAVGDTPPAHEQITRDMLETTDHLLPDDAPAAMDQPPAAVEPDEVGKQRRRLSEDERQALGVRNANRMEELRLHIGIDLDKIDPKSLQAPPGKVVDLNLLKDLPPEQRRRLLDLGLAESSGTTTDKASAPQEADQQRLVTEDLDNILDRLDDALGDDEPGQAPPSDASEAEAEAEQAPDGRDDHDAVPAPDHSKESTEEIPVEDLAKALDGLGEDDDIQAAPSDKPKAAATELPAWARADSFDDDIDDDDSSNPNPKPSEDDGSDPKQQNLFD
jgi:hypothetical protein